jgi:hypothetical protein
MLFDADNRFGIYQTASGSNFFIDAITNKGTSGVTLSSAATARPLYPTAIGRRASMNFDGINDAMQATSSAISGAHTVFILCNITSTGVAILLEHSPDWNSNNGMLINPNSSTEMGYGVRRSASNSARTASTTTTGEHVWAFRADGTHANQAIWKDGTALSTTSVGPGYNSNVGTGTVTDTLNLGARNNASLYIAANVGCLLIYNSTLSDHECALVSNSIKQYWGVV